MINRLKSSAIFWMLVSIFSFTTMQLFVKMTSSDVSVFTQVFARNLFGIAAAAFFIKKEHLPVFGSLKEQPFLFGRSLSGFLYLVTYFYATKMGNIADVTIVNRTGPFFTTLFSVLFLKETASLPQWIALILVFMGGIIAGNPSFDSSMLPMVLALISAVCNGISYTLLARFRDHVPAMTVVMHFSAVSVLLSLPFAIKDFSVPCPHDMLMLALIALTGTIGVISITLTYRLAPASEISIYDQMSIIVSVALGWVFLGEVPSVNTIIGGTVVIAVSCWIFKYNKRRSHSGLQRRSLVSLSHMQANSKR